MEAMVSADSCRNPCFLVESLIFESATDAERKKRMEIRRLKQQIASSANDLQVFNSKRSRPLSASSYVECNGEQLLEPLSLGEVPKSSQSFHVMRGIQMRGQTFCSAEPSVRCSGLVRSASFPPEGWER
eukprot:c25500_g1_i1 orf=682-1068(+)